MGDNGWNWNDSKVIEYGESNEMIIEMIGERE
jgi:hypothetical protein